MKICFQGLWMFCHQRMSPSPIKCRILRLREKSDWILCSCKDESDLDLGARAHFSALLPFSGNSGSECQQAGQYRLIGLVSPLSAFWYFASLYFYFATFLNRGFLKLIFGNIFNYHFFPPNSAFWHFCFLNLVCILAGIFDFYYFFSI